jgi:octopine/nopaline transport system substrate-binding protein
MNRRQTLLALAAVPFLAGAAGAEGVPARITIATEGAYPPWNFTKADGTLAGYEIELIDVLCARMQVECEVVSQEWNGIIPGLTSGKYDAIIASLGVTDERKAVVAFSAPYARAPNGFLTTGGNALKDLPQAGVSFNLADAPAAAEAALAALTEPLAGKSSGCRPVLPQLALPLHTLPVWMCGNTRRLNSLVWN